MPDDPFAAYQTPAADPFAAYQQPSPEALFASARRESQARTAANTPTFMQDVGSTAQQLGKNIWGAVKGGAEFAGNVFSAGSGLDTGAGGRLYKSVVQPQVQQLQKAGQAATGTGEFTGAPPISRAAGTVGYGAAGLLPGAGPMAARGGEKAAAKDYPGAIADVGTAAAMGVAPEYLGRAAGAVTGKIREFTTPNPDTTFYQALPWRHEIPDFQEMSPILRGDIKRAAQQSQGAPPSTTGVGGGWQPITPTTPTQLSGEVPLNDIPSTLKGVQAGKAENRAIVDLHVDPYRQSGWTGYGGPIADEIVNSIPATLRARAQAGIPEAVAEVNRIVQEANVYRSQFTPDEIFGLNREFNAGLNNFFHRTADAQHALIGKGGDTATLEAAARGTRNLIRNSFGDDVANLQRRWGWLDDAEEGLRAQWKKVMKSPEETPASDLDAAMLKAGIPGKLTHGDVTGAKFAWRGGKTDSLLQDTFNNTEPGWPLPTPQPRGMPGVGGMPRAQGPSRQLPPATPQIGSGGYVSATGMRTPPQGPLTGGMSPGPQQNVWQGIGAPQQPPAGSPTQGQGVIQVPPAGAANPYTGPRPNPNPELTQIPPSPRAAAPPPDTSFVRKGPSPFGSKRGSFSNRPATESINTSGRTFIKDTRPSAEDYTLMEVPTNAINSRWTEPPGQENFYIRPGGGGAEISGRRAQFSQFLQKGQPIEAPRIAMTEGGPENGRIVFEDGRHRFSILRDAGDQTTAVMVPNEQVADFQALNRGPQEPLAKRMGKTIWNAVRPKLPAEQDIDFQQRFGEKEQPEVAKFLGYDNPERGGSGVVQVDPRQLIPTEPPELLHLEAIERQRQMFRQGSTPPPIKIFYDENGQPTISGGAGHHRRAAAILEGVPTIPAQVIDPSEARIMPAEARQQAVSRARDWGDIGAGLNAEEKAAIGIGKEK